MKPINMNYTKNGIIVEPLKVFRINGEYILGIYKGGLSEFDLLIKYRQKNSNTSSGWSRIRTPKLIHWAVDILLKMNQEPKRTKEFLNSLLNYWDKEVTIISSAIERNELLTESFINEVTEEAEKYKELANNGEYSVKFLILIAKLLMFQEKTNRNDAYMFRTLLVALENGEDIFKIVSVATHR
ncbi:MAG: hypothetical protein R2863_12400 [Candidatus Kapaibacterium sp.]|nr:hypothetical protein [Ignavibacteriota bacterium]